MATTFDHFSENNIDQRGEKSWQRLFGYKLLPLVIEDKKFVDGELQEEAA
ncbi:MAG: hypothetical protein ACOCUV_00790 [bacterium]